MNTAPRPDSKPAERRVLTPGREWLTLKVSVTKADETESRKVRTARILNVSRTGVLLQARIPLARGERIRMHLGEGEAVLASVRWADQNLAGCEFDNPLARCRLSSVLLQGVNSNVPAAPAHQAARGHPDKDTDSRPIGERIVRKRKAMSMTQSELGDAVNVSTATICKWERDQARPRRRAIQRLSAILDEDLLAAAGPLTGPGSQDADFARCVQGFKHTIASILGIDEGSVSVMISA